MQTTSIIDSVLGIFTEIGNWIPGALEALMAIFWSDTTGLTVFGVLGICGLAFSVCFLILGLVQKFLRFG